MADVTAGDGVTYSDGETYGFCSREKAKRTFYGVVELTETGRVLASGPCDTCGTVITKVLYTP